MVVAHVVPEVTEGGQQVGFGVGGHAQDHADVAGRVVLWPVRLLHFHGTVWIAALRKVGPVGDHARRKLLLAHSVVEERSS